ncbi:MAG: DUF4861 domain-containing protein [Bacteroidaceae bacterium]|nr:DUF4861 domain-containing protein [Bacteroidaceae bacterium]MBQ9640006.1 DUF4861 domain-containing protein [Bacteroidaceae bacterium]
MKRYCLLLIGFVSLFAAAQQRTFTVHVKNTAMDDWRDVPVVVDVRRVHFDVKSAKVVLNGREVPCQLDDMDGDCRVDELVFLADVQPMQKRKYKVTISGRGTQKEYPARVYAHMGLNDKYGKLPTIHGIEAPGDSYIFKDVYPHGAEFESELTAFRVYVDNRQNIDLYGKRKRRLELEKTHFYSVKEDLEAGYGNDVLWAGGSMGCGTLRELKGGSPVLIDDVKVRGQRVVAYGPLRTVVEMKDMGWNGNNVRTRYILYAGHREVEVQVESDGPLRHLQLCTGVQRVGTEAVGWTQGNGLAASWGKDYPDYGKKELYQPEAVGLGVYVPADFFAGTAEDSLQYMCKLRMNRQHFLKYYVTFCADMEEEGYHSADEWFAYLRGWRERMLRTPKIKYFIRLNNK